jgi:hypothetical protein
VEIKRLSELVGEIKELDNNQPPRLIRYKNHVYQRLVAPRKPYEGRPRRWLF